ncbi:hypothetical protein AGMMS49940_23720 [Spirochaetia bacterium]|nr:hypothetical protein AGMMS49940_23700 [Spirochaetia bacterium]GHV75070.1 hypothetical protein AGMMS49940_23720 [Spirochaetia bacterium]
MTILGKHKPLAKALRDIIRDDDDGLLILNKPKKCMDLLEVKTPGKFSDEKTVLRDILYINNKTQDDIFLSKIWSLQDKKGRALTHHKDALSAEIQGKTNHTILAIKDAVTILTFSLKKPVKTGVKVIVIVVILFALSGVGYAGYQNREYIAVQYQKVVQVLEENRQQRIERAERRAREKAEAEERKAAEERRIAEEKAAEERRIAEEKAAEERRIAEEKARKAEERNSTGITIFALVGGVIGVGGGGLVGGIVGFILGGLIGAFIFD